MNNLVKAGEVSPPHFCKIDISNAQNLDKFSMAAPETQVDMGSSVPSQPYLKAKFRIGSCKGPKNFSFAESGTSRSPLRAVLN